MFVTGIRVGELVVLKHKVFNGNLFKIRCTETKYIVEDGNCVYDIKEFPKSDTGVRTVIVPNDYLWCVKNQIIKSIWWIYFLK